MGTLIVDIETKAEAWHTLPGITRAALTSWIDRTHLSDELKQRKRDEVLSQLSLSPFTGSIISLAVFDVERREGAVYYVAPQTEAHTIKDGDFTFKIRTEKEILEDFWEGARSYDVFVTFNGRSFAVPFLYHRSVIQSVRPTVDIAKQRYVTKQTVPYHVDLLDEMSFHGSMRHRPSLQLLCGAYGLANESILGGEEVEAAYADGHYQLIAEKNAGDVRAITELYETWKLYIAPPAFLNTLEIL